MLIEKERDSKERRGKEFTASVDKFGRGEVDDLTATATATGRTDKQTRVIMMR